MHPKPLTASNATKVGRTFFGPFADDSKLMSDPKRATAKLPAFGRHASANSNGAEAWHRPRPKCGPYSQYFSQYAAESSSICVQGRSSWASTDTSWHFARSASVWSRRRAAKAGSATTATASNWCHRLR